MRAAWVLFGVWAVVHFVVFSAQKGIFHPYYTSALAPAVAALCGAGVVTLCALGAHAHGRARPCSPPRSLATAGVAVTLLRPHPDYAPFLRVAIPVAAALAVIGVGRLRIAPRRVRRGGRGGGGDRARGRPGRLQRHHRGPLAQRQQRARRPGERREHGRARRRPGGARPTGSGPPSGGPPSGAGGGGMGGGGSLSATTIAYLEAHQGSAKYLVAVTGSQTSASIIIATGKPVVTIGGFNGQDPAPTVSQLAAMVKRGELSLRAAVRHELRPRDLGARRTARW